MQRGSVPDKLPDVLSEEEVEAMIAARSAADVRRERRYPTVLRNRVLVQVALYRCALRLAEACALERRDIRWTESRLRVRRGKGNRERYVRLSADSIAQLQLWDQRRPKGAETFFCTLDGGPLDHRYVQRMVKRMAARAGLEDPGRVHPHIFRHSRATHLRRMKHEQTKIQQLLGHKDIRTTMVYDHIVQGEMEEMIEGADEVLP